MPCAKLGLSERMHGRVDDKGWLSGEFRVWCRCLMFAKHQDKTRITPGPASQADEVSDLIFTMVLRSASMTGHSQAAAVMHATAWKIEAVHAQAILRSFVSGAAHSCANDCFTAASDQVPAGCTE